MGRKQVDMLMALAVLLGLSTLVWLLVRNASPAGFPTDVRSRIEAYLQRSLSPPEVERPLRPEAPPADPVPLQAPAPVRPVEPLPIGATPARALTPQMIWVLPDDYPADALRNGWSGRVKIGWTISVDGRAVDCHTIQSSGHEVLDEAACRAIMARARYEPARDVAGVAIASSAQQSIAWHLP